VLIKENVFSKLDYWQDIKLIDNYQEATKLSDGIKLNFLNVHNIDFDNMFNEIDRAIEEIIQGYAIRYQEEQKKKQEKQKKFEQDLEETKKQWEEFEKTIERLKKNWQKFEEFFTRGPRSYTLTTTDALKELELPENTTHMNIIKKAYYRLVQKHHPDKSHNAGRKNEADEKTKRLVGAYEVLKLKFEKNK